MLQLRSYQKAALKFLRQRSYRAGIFFGTGTGKTLPVVSTINKKLNNRKWKKVLIICNRDDYLTWKKEFAKFGMPSSYFQFLETGKDALSQFASVYFCSYGLVRKNAILRQLLKTKLDLVVCDEAHKLRNSKTQQTKNVLEIAAWCKRKIALTATPIGKDLTCLWSIGKFIDGGETFGKYYWGFLTRYFNKIPTGQWVPRRRTAEVFKEKLATISRSLRTQDVLDLPPVITKVIGVPAIKKQQKTYNSCNRDWELPEEYELNWITTRLSKLRQIASGFYYDDKRKVHNVGTEKVGAIERIIDAHPGSRVVIFYYFKPEVEFIKQALRKKKLKFVHISGSATHRTAARKAFAAGKATCAMIQVDTAVGMNELVKANVGIYFTNSYRPDSKTQSLGRIWRSGSEVHKRIFVYELVTEETIDEAILSALEHKINLGSEILKAARIGVTEKYLKSLANKPHIW